MTSAARAEVVIVGGGPAGSTLAIRLARAGLAVTLIEQSRFPRDKPCAEYLSPQALSHLHALDVLERVERVPCAQLTGMEVHAPSGTSFSGEFRAQHGFVGFADYGLGIRRKLLDALLLDQARDGGVDVRESAKATGLLNGSAGVEGVVIREDEQEVVLRAGLVVGADGFHSLVARRLGLVRTGRWPRRPALVTHFREVANLGPLGEMHVADNGYLGIAAVGAGVANVALVVPRTEGRELAGDPVRFLHQWIAGRRALAPRFQEAERITPVRAT